MGRKLYVGNLADEVYAETLDELFSQYGSVDTIRIITDQETGRSKGYGFVEMSSEPEGAAAIEALNGTECKGRVIKVSEAKPSKSRRRPQHSGNSSRGGGRGYGGGRGGAGGGRDRGNGGGGRGRGNGGGGRGRGGAGGGRGRGGGGRGRGSSGGGRGRGGGGGGRR